MTTGIYEDEILGAPDVCSNCFRQVRVERVEPTRSGLGNELEATYGRNKQTTQIGYAPSEAVSESKGVFCECGVESARHRIWDAEDLARDRYSALIKNVIRTLEAKDVTFSRKRLAAHALQGYKDGDGPDEALAEAIDIAVVAANT